MDFVRGRLAACKCPRTIDFVDDLPRLPGGKIQRRIVREPCWAGRTKQIRTQVEGAPVMHARSPWMLEWQRQALGVEGVSAP